MDGKVISLSQRLAARAGIHFTSAPVIDLMLRHLTPPAPEVTNYQLIEGQGLRRQTAGGWVWVNPQDCIDCGTGEFFQINSGGFWKGVWVGGTAVLLVAGAAIAVLASITAEKLAQC